MIVPQSLIYNNNDDADYELFSAFQPTLNMDSSPTTVYTYSCSENALDNSNMSNSQGVMVSKSQSGESVWYTSIK